MKKRSALLLFLLIPLSGTTGCDRDDPPAVDPPVADQPVDPPVDPPADDPLPNYTAEPGANPFLLGKVWQLEGILDLESNTLTKLATADNAGSYSICFDSDSTATGRILNTEMQVGLSRPFFQLSGSGEENEEAKTFARLASGITGCEYYSFEDTLMRFYNEDYKTCLVFKFRGVRDKTGVMTYFSLYGSQSGRWTIRDAGDGGARVILYDGGDEYIPEDIPDSFKQPGLKVKFSGDVTPTPYIEIGEARLGSTESFYLINISSLEELP
jgi:hypothetical protein